MYKVIAVFEGSIPPSLYPHASDTPSISEQFTSLLETWNTEKRSNKQLLATSDAESLTKTPSYEAIIALGQPVLPLLLAELQRGNHLMNRATFCVSGLCRSKLVGAQEIVGEELVSQRLLHRLLAPV